MARLRIREWPVRGGSHRTTLRRDGVPGAAQFWFDASRSGQRTINWLILSLLNAAYDVLLPSGFIFNEVENLAKYGVEASDEKVVHLALRAAGQSSDAGSPPVESSRLPPGLVQYAGVRSDSFAILQTPSLEWESFRLAVYFEDWPNREQQRDLRDTSRGVVASGVSRRLRRSRRCVSASACILEEAASGRSYAVIPAIRTQRSRCPSSSGSWKTTHREPWLSKRSSLGLTRR